MSATKVGRVRRTVKGVSRKGTPSRPALEREPFLLGRVADPADVQGHARPSRRQTTDPDRAMTEHRPVE